MNETEARMLREARRIYIRRIDTKSRAWLAEAYRADLADQGRQILFGGPSTRNELIAALVELHYPDAKMYEAIHITGHTARGFTACEHCHDDDGTHAGHLCDCERHADTDCTAPGCQHPRAAFHFSTTHMGPGRRPILHPHESLGHVYQGPLGRLVDTGAGLHFTFTSQS